MEKRSVIVRIGILVLFIVCSSFLAAEVPKEVKAMAGIYKGEWSMFGINESGDIIKKMSWTDTVTASNPVIQDGRAFVTTVDEMVFEGGMGSRKLDGKEGYFLNGDGSLGDYFFESGGQITRMIKLNDHAWVYTIPANPYENTMLGFLNVVDVQHVMIKVVALEEGIETHRVSRLTTVSWKDAKGQVQRKQFVSLQGLHKRVK